MFPWNAVHQLAALDPINFAAGSDMKESTYFCTNLEN